MPTVAYATNPEFAVASQVLSALKLRRDDGEVLRDNGAWLVDLRSNTSQKYATSTHKFVTWLKSETVATSAIGAVAGLLMGLSALTTVFLGS